MQRYVPPGAADGGVQERGLPRRTLDDLGPADPGIRVRRELVLHKRRDDVGAEGGVSDTVTRHVISRHWKQICV